MKRSKVSQRIQVAVRIRPRHRLAILEDGKTEIEELLTVHGRTITLAGSGFGVAQALAYDDDAAAREKSSHHFTFDHVVDSREDDRHSPNNKIFECVGKPIVPHLLDGYNACVLAYGQTGSGKTFTMMGARYGGGAIKSVGASSRRGTLVLPSLGGVGGGQTPAESLNVSSIAEDTAGGVNEEDMAARIDSGDGLIPRIVASLFSQFCPDNQDNDADTNNAFFMSPSGGEGGATPLPSARGTTADFGMVDGGETPRVTEAFTPRPMPQLRRRHVNVLIECSIVELYSESPACLISRYTVQKSKRLAKGGGGGGKDTKPLVEPQCEVRESLEEGPHVQGAAKVTLYDSTRAGITAMEAAREAVAFVHNVVTTTRHVSSTLQNEVSSRSHVIITFFVTQKEWVLGQPGKRSNGTVVVTKSRVQLVDLAGSERVGAHGLVDPIFMPPNDDSASEINIRGTTLLMSPGIDTSAKKAAKASSMLGILSPSGGAGGNTQFGEGIKINKSLLTLGRIVEMLASKGKGKHDGGVPPFRDSKLTFILKPSLGGDSLTSIVACVHAPLRNTARAADALTDYYHETLNTLQFANRAKNIGLHASSHKQIDSRSLEVAALVAENNKLREQLQEMQSHVASLVMMKNSSYGSLLSPMMINNNDNNNALAVTNGEEEDASPGRWSDILAPKPPQTTATSGTVVARQNQSFELPPNKQQQVHHQEGAAHEDAAVVEALLLPVAPVALSRERNGDRTLAYRLDYRPERLRLLEIVFEDKNKNNANGAEEEDFDVSSSSSSSSSTSTGRELSDAEEEEDYVRDAAQSLQHEYDMVDDSPPRTATATTKKHKKNSKKNTKSTGNKGGDTANELSTPVHGPSLRADDVGALLYPDASPSSAVTKANRAFTKKSIRMPFTLRNRRLSVSAPTNSMLGWVRTKQAAEPNEALTEGKQQQQQQFEDNDNNNGTLLHYLEIPIAILEASHILHNGSSPLYTIAVDGAKVLPPPTTTMGSSSSVPPSSFVSVPLFSGSIISISLPKSLLAEGSVSRYSFQYVISDKSSRRMGGGGRGGGAMMSSTMALPNRDEFVDRPLPLTASALIAGSQMGLHVDANEEFYSAGGGDGSPTVRQLYLRMSASASPDRAAYNQHISPSANRKSMRAVNKLEKEYYYNNGKGDARFSLNDDDNAVFGSLIASAVAARAPSVTVRELSVALHDPLVRPREVAAPPQLYEDKERETNVVEPVEIRFDETSAAIGRNEEDHRLSGTTTQQRKTIFNRPTTTTTAAVVNARNINNMNSKDYGLRRTNVDFDASPTAAIAIESIDMAELNVNTNNGNYGEAIPAARPSAVVVAATESVVFEEDLPATDFSSALAFYELNSNGRDSRSGDKGVFEMDVGGVRRRFDDADTSSKSVAAAALFTTGNKRSSTTKLPSSSFPSSHHHQHYVKDTIDAEITTNTPQKRGGGAWVGVDNYNRDHNNKNDDSPRPTVLKSDHLFDGLLISEGGSGIAADGTRGGPHHHQQQESPARYDEGSPYRWAPAIQSVRAEVEMVLAEECEHLTYRVSAATSPHHHRNRTAKDGGEDRGEDANRQRSASRARKSTTSKSRSRTLRSSGEEEEGEEGGGVASSKSCSPNTIKSLQQTVMSFELNGTLSGSVAVVPPEQQEHHDTGLNDDSQNEHSTSSSSSKASSGSDAESSCSTSSSYSLSSSSSPAREAPIGEGEEEEQKGGRKRNVNKKKKNKQRTKKQPYTFNTLTSMMQTLRTATDPSVCPTLQREIHSALMQLYPPCFPLPVGEGNFEGTDTKTDKEATEEEEGNENVDEREAAATSSSVQRAPTATPSDNAHRPNLLHSLLFDEATLKDMLRDLTQAKQATAALQSCDTTTEVNTTISATVSSKILAKLLGRHLFLIDGYWLWLCREVIHAKPKRKSESDSQGEGEEQAIGNEAEEEIRVRGFLLQAEERRTPTNAFRVRSPTLDLPFGGDLIALLKASTDINVALSDTNNTYVRTSSPTRKEKKKAAANNRVVLQPPPPVNFTPAPLSKILELLHRMQQVSTWTSDAVNAALTNTVDAVMAKVKATAPLLLSSNSAPVTTIAEIIEEKRQQVQALVESFIHDLPVTSCSITSAPPLSSTSTLLSGNPPPPPPLPICRLIRCSNGGRPSDTFSFFFSKYTHENSGYSAPLLAFAELYSTSFSPAPAADNGVGIRVKVTTNSAETHHHHNNNGAAAAAEAATTTTLMTLPWVDWNFSSRDPLLISSKESVTAIAQNQLRLLPEIARLREALMAVALPPPAAVSNKPATRGHEAPLPSPPPATTTTAISPSTHTHTHQTIDAADNKIDGKASSSLPSEEEGIKVTTTAASEIETLSEIPHRHHVDPSSSSSSSLPLLSHLTNTVGDVVNAASLSKATATTSSSSSSLSEGQKMLLRLRKEKGLPTMKKQPQAQAQEVASTDKHLFVSTDVMEAARALLDKTTEERLGKMPRSAGANNKNLLFSVTASSPSVAAGRLARTQSFVNEALLRSPLTHPPASVTAASVSVSSPAVAFESVVTTTSTTAATNDPQTAALKTLTASSLIANLMAELQRTKAEAEEANAALQSEVTTAIVIKDQLQRSLAAAERQLSEEHKRADEAVADTNHKFAILEADYEAAMYSHGKIRQQLEAQMRLTDNLQTLVEDREELIKRLRSDAEDRKQENDMLSLQVAVLKRDLARANNGVGETTVVVSPPQHTSGVGATGQEEGSRPSVVESSQQSPSPRRRIVIPTSSSSSKGVGTAADVHGGEVPPNKESVSYIAQSIANAVVKGMPSGASLAGHSPRTANVRAKTAAQTTAKSTANDGADQRKKAGGQGNERSPNSQTAAAATRESETYCEAEDGGRKRTSVGSPNIKPNSKHQANSSKSPNDAARNPQSQQREDRGEESRSPRRLPPSTTAATPLGGDLQQQQTVPVVANGGSLAPSPMGAARRTCTVALCQSVSIGSSPTSVYLKKVGAAPQSSPHRRLAPARASSPKAVTQQQAHSLSEDQQKLEVARESTNSTTKVPSPADGTTTHASGAETASPSLSISSPDDAASYPAAETESEKKKGVTAAAAASTADTVAATNPAPKERVAVGSLQKYNNTVSGHVSNLRLVNKAAKKQQPEEEEKTPLPPQESEDGSATAATKSSANCGTNTNKALGSSGKFIPNNRRPAIDDPHAYLFLEYQKTQHELKEAIKLIESKDELFAREKARLERESEERSAEIARLSNEMQVLADKLVQRDHRIPLKGSSGSGTATPLQQSQQQQSAAALMGQASSTLLDRCRRRRSSSTSSCPNAAGGGERDFSRTPTGDGAQQQQQQQQKTSSSSLSNSTTALASSYKLRTPTMTLLNQARSRAPSANNTKGRVIGGGANTTAKTIQSPAAPNDEGLVNTPAPTVATFSARAGKPQQEGAAKTAEGAVSTPINPKHTIVVSASGLPPLVIEHRLAEVKKELQRSTREKDKYRKMLDERDGQILALMTELRTAKAVVSQVKPRSSSNSGSGVPTRSNSNPRGSMATK